VKRVWAARHAIPLSITWGFALLFAGQGQSGSMSMPDRAELSRRAFLGSLAALAALGGRPAGAAAALGPILIKKIPVSGEAVPVIGMGSWITFNVGDDPAMRSERVRVLQAFFEMGGAVIDSSPMYGTSEEVIGHCLAQIGNGRPFAATKVWTPLQMFGPGQMEDSRAYWGIERFDLMQVHNLLNWEGHLETLREDKAEGRSAISASRPHTAAGTTSSSGS
jgi:Aldo/keto reductase family